MSRSKRIRVAPESEPPGVSTEKRQRTGAAVGDAPSTTGSPGGSQGPRDGGAAATGLGSSTTAAPGPLGDAGKDDYYAVLGIEPGVSSEQVRTAFKKRARQTHPDKGGTSAEFSLVFTAFNTLADPDSRRRYDETYFQRKRSRWSCEDWEDEDWQLPMARCWKGAAAARALFFGFLEAGRSCWAQRLPILPRDILEQMRFLLTPLGAIEDGELVSLGASSSSDVRALVRQPGYFNVSARQYSHHRNNCPWTILGPLFHGPVVLWRTLCHLHNVRAAYVVSFTQRVRGVRCAFYITCL